MKIDARGTDLHSVIMRTFRGEMSEGEFAAQYGTEAQCRDAVIALRWRDGFKCPSCDGRAHTLLRTRGLFQCTSCRRQTSPIAGTIFASTHLSLSVWFRAMYLLAQSDFRVPTTKLGVRLGVTQATAWKVKRKLARTPSGPELPDRSYNRSV
jgi:ribosomal protein L37AE/L43A